MERRRLRLHGAAPITPVQVTAGGGPSQRLPLPGRCLSVTDTEQGNLATLWALDMLEAFSAAGSPVTVVFTAFEQAPELPLALSARIFAAAHQVHLLTVSRDPARFADVLTALPAQLSTARAPEGALRPPAPVWLMVGTPALLAFESFASVLVTNDLGPERWPPGMRALRRGLALEVSSTRPALTRALARLLLTTI